MNHVLQLLCFLTLTSFLLLSGCNNHQTTINGQPSTVNSEHLAVASEQSTVDGSVAPLLEASPLAPATYTSEPLAPATLAAAATPTAVPISIATATLTPTPAFPVYEGAPLDRELMGVQVHIHREDLPEMMGHLQALGMGWVKVQVSWKLYESEPGQYTDRFEELDKLVELAAANDIRVLLSVSKAPEWSRPTTEMDGPPIANAHYTEFMAFLAGRYKGRVAAYELWNEPNLQREWNGSPLSAADLVRLIGAGAAGVRTADPDAILISAAPATTGINDGLTATDDRVFLRGMLEAGIGEYVNAVGVHPYGWANPPDSKVTAPDPGVPSHNNHPSFFFAETLDDYTALLEEYGVERPLWVTEFGWGSFEGIEDDEGDPASPPAGAEFMNNVSEWQQAQYITRAYELGQQAEIIGPMILWNLNFGPLLGNEFSESGYGLLRPDGAKRLTYLALQNSERP